MSDTKKTEIVKTAQNEVSALPDYILAAQTMNEYKDFDQSEIVMPMLMIAQDGNPLCKRGHADAIDGLSAGMWFDTQTKEVIGESVEVIYIDHATTHGVYTPAPEGKFKRPISEAEYNRIAQYLEYSETMRGMSDPTGQYLAADEVIGERDRVLCLRPDNLKAGPVIMYLKPGSFKTLKAWRTKIKAKGIPHHMAVWALPLILDSNDSGNNWYNFGKGNETSAIFKRFVTQQELDICDKLYFEFNSSRSIAEAKIKEQDY